MGFIVSAMLWFNSFFSEPQPSLKGEFFSPCPTSYHVHAVTKQNIHRKVATPLSQEQLVIVLEASHVRVFGTVPKPTKLAMGWAQVSLENGRGKYIYNNNIGNIGPSKKSQQDFYHHLGHRGYPYRSFKTIEEGADAYWRTIKKCRVAVRAFDVGDPWQSAKALKSCNYYMAPLESYNKNLSSLYHEGHGKVVPRAKNNR
jgi:hypothetical protein